MAAKTLLAGALVGAMLLAGLGGAQPGAGRESGDPPYEGYRAEGYPGISYPSRAMALSFVRPGILAEITVEENDLVEPGQLLARQRDEVQKHVVETQRLSAVDRTELAAAERRLELSDYEYQNQLEAFEKDAASPRELERARTEKEIREIDVEAAKRNIKQSQAVYERELAVLEDMRIASEIHGRIIRIEREVGEAVDGLEPVIRLASIDPLFMDVDVPVELGLQISEGDAAEINWRNIDVIERSMGRVKFVSSVADSAANRIIVRLEVPNPDEIPAGLHALVRFPKAEEAFTQARR